MFLLSSCLQLHTWAKWDTFRVFLMPVYSLVSHRLWDTDFTLMETSPWSRSGVTTDKQRCNAHFLISFELRGLYLDQERWGFVAGCRKWGQGRTKCLFFPSPSRRHKLAQKWCCCFVPVFEVFLIQVSRSHWQLHDNMFSPCCFQIKNKMRFPLLCPANLFFSIFKPKLYAIITPLKSRVIVPLPAV